MKIRTIDPLASNIIGKMFAVERIERYGTPAADCCFAVVVRSLKTDGEGKVVAVCTPKAGIGEFEIQATKLFEMPTAKEFAAEALLKQKQDERDAWKRKVNKRNSLFKDRKCALIESTKAGKINAAQALAIREECEAQGVAADIEKIKTVFALDKVVDIVEQVLWPGTEE